MAPPGSPRASARSRSPPGRLRRRSASRRSARASQCGRIGSSVDWRVGSAWVAWLVASGPRRWRGGEGVQPRPQQEEARQRRDQGAEPGAPRASARGRSPRRGGRAAVPVFGGVRSLGGGGAPAERSRAQRSGWSGVRPCPRALERGRDSSAFFHLRGSLASPRSNTASYAVQQGAHRDERLGTVLRCAPRAGGQGAGLQRRQPAPSRP